jgi:hypothetical protein
MQAAVAAARKEAAAANHPFAALCGCDIHIALRILDATPETEREKAGRLLGDLMAVLAELEALR